MKQELVQTEPNSKMLFGRSDVKFLADGIILLAVLQLQLLLTHAAANPLGLKSASIDNQGPRRQTQGSTSESKCKPRVSRALIAGPARVHVPPARHTLAHLNRII